VLFRSYRFNWFLLGGYCKLKDETIASKDKDSFTNLPYLKKFYISVAGCTINILMGLFMLSPNANISYFGYLSLVLGITNLIPLAPCLDGGYVVYLPLFLKIWGKVKGMKIFDKSVQISFNILMALNIICVPFLIYYFRFEILRNIVLCLFTYGDFLIRVFPGILL
jgi:membrane-associated protease RseP (regulator of RpoE activity)